MLTCGNTVVCRQIKLSKTKKQKQGRKEASKLWVEEEGTGGWLLPITDFVERIQTKGVQLYTQALLPGVGISQALA